MFAICNEHTHKLLDKYKMQSYNENNQIINHILRKCGSNQCMNDGTKKNNEIKKVDAIWVFINMTSEQNVYSNCWKYSRNYDIKCLTILKWFLCFKNYITIPGMIYFSLFHVWWTDLEKSRCFQFELVLLGLTSCDNSGIIWSQHIELLLTLRRLFEWLMCCSTYTVHCNT